MKTKKLLTSILPFLSVCLTSCSGGNVHHDAKDYFVDIDYKSDFKILQLSDLHMGMEDDLDYHFKFVDLTIKDANPDFIMVTGDVLTFATPYVIDKVFGWLDSHEVPWGVTFGNHDEQVYVSVNDLTNRLNKNYKYCAFLDLQDDDVYGNANYVVNLNKDGKVKAQIISLDSNRYRYGSYMGYDYFHEDQVDWYERVVKYSTEQNGGTAVPSFAFFHIPFQEYETAYQLYKDGSSEVTWHYGENKENVSCPKEQPYSLFNKMVELGSTKATFVGHDHVNNSDITYKGIELVFGIKGTDRVYADENQLGGLVITLHDDDTYDLSRIYHKYAEVK